MAITQELRDYISEVRAQGIPDEQIIEELVTAGWSSADINLAISEPAKSFPAPELKTALPVIDNYEPEPVKKVEQPTTRNVNPSVFPVSQNTLATSTTTSFVKPSASSVVVQTKTPWLLVFVLSLFFGAIFSGVFILIFVFIPPVNKFVSSFVENKSTYVSNSPEKSTTNDQVAYATPTPTQTETATNDTMSSTAQITADDAWKVFDKSLIALKEMSENGDVTKLNAVSFRQFPACEKGAEEECMLTGGLLYDMGASLNKEDYVNVSADNKQIILSTNLTKNDNNTAKVPTIGYQKGYIFMAKDSSGNLKVVSIEPERGWSVTKSSQGAAKQLEDMVLDTDGDGLTDQQETCVNGAPKCVKTDPTKLDTDGNGYWDGIDYFLNESK